MSNLKDKVARAELNIAVDKLKKSNALFREVISEKITVPYDLYCEIEKELKKDYLQYKLPAPRYIKLDKAEYNVELSLMGLDDKMKRYILDNVKNKKKNNSQKRAINYNSKQDYI